MAKREPQETQDRVLVQRTHAPTFALTVLFDSFAFAVELPTRGSIVIGRDESADLVIPLPSVSRDHARVDLDGERAAIVDLGSRNGTTVNGDPVSAEGRSLDPGDEMEVGDATVVIFRRGALPPGARPLMLGKALEARITASITERASPNLYVLQTDEAFFTETAMLEALAQVPAGAYVGVLNQRALAVATSDPAVDVWLRQRIGELGVSFGVASARQHPGTSDLVAAAFADLVERTRARGERLLGETPVISPGIEEVFEYAKRIASSPIAVLITGETGTGKEVFARAIHRMSGRAGPLISVNTAALPEALVESELFGHERGAFSGAMQPKAGLIEAANRGTLFLDEIAELPLSMQAKLLRVLEDHVVRRVGATTERHVDIRVIAATHRDLGQAVEEKRFRQDLLFRLNAATIELPPLRERVGEIPRLAHELLAEVAHRSHRPPPSIDRATLELLEQYPFPGNVRELKNLIERAALVVTGDVILPEHLPPHVRRGSVAPVAGDAPADARARDAASVRASIKAFERTRLHEALEKTGFNQTKAAELLGLPRRTLAYKMLKLGIFPEK